MKPVGADFLTWHTPIYGFKFNDFFPFGAMAIKRSIKKLDLVEFV
jgi:hypothetical protein